MSAHDDPDDASGQVWAHEEDEWRIYLLLRPVWTTADGHVQYQALNLHHGTLHTFMPHASSDMFKRIA